ncbi:hypothetical protein TorRG33x02_261470 [Trema orientale]|uniref:Reverse transcriptase zinc-binding domain-containing protein n=1 Tax=Trema orientale TaxID=63057 RepID=A0A2P5D5W2_TREOI|nr:hypothetical protein TorRG33x02_261470 [Trema orientale]
MSISEDRVSQFNNNFLLSGWNFHLIINLNEREFTSYMALSNLLEGVTISEEAEDKRIWSFDRSKGFSCKSAFHFLRKEGCLQDLSFYNFIWEGLVLTEVKFFAWTLGVGKLHIIGKVEGKRCGVAPFGLLCGQFGRKETLKF